MTFNVNADCFRAAAVCQSTEDVRYYINGVHIEPHRVKGVFLVATDGHRLVVIHDESGSTDRSVIVRLDKATMKATKATRGETEARRVTQNESGEVWVTSHDGHKQAFASDAPIVDGTFPEWRRVLPGRPETVENPDTRLLWYGADYLAAFGTVATELVGKGRHFIRIEPGYNGGPALIRMSGIEHAFGVLMPAANSRNYPFPEGIPDFVNAAPTLATAA